MLSHPYGRLWSTKTENIKHWWRCDMEELECSYITGGNVKSYSSVESGLVFLQEVEHRNDIGPYTYPKELKTGVQKLVQKVHSNTIHNSQNVETQISINWWMNKQLWYIHKIIQSQKWMRYWYCLPHGWILNTCKWKKLATKAIYCVTSFICTSRIGKCI